MTRPLASDLALDPQHRPCTVGGTRVFPPRSARRVGSSEGRDRAYPETRFVREVP